MHYFQYITNTCVGLAVASTSLHVLWPSVALGNILLGNSPIPQAVTKEEISWIVMSLFLGTIPGAMISGWMLQSIGRKYSLLILTALLFILWVPIAFTSSIWLLCVERCIAGIAISALIIVVTLYNSEIADKEIRGRLGSTLNGWSLFGELLVVSTGPYLSYQNFALLNCGLPLIAMVLIFFMPESPYHLIQKGKRDEAQFQVERLLSGTKDKGNVNSAVNEIETIVTMEKKNESSMWSFLTDPIYRKSLCIIIGIKFLQQLSGSSAFSEFTDKIIETNRSSISRDSWEIILNAIPLIGALVCGLLVDKIGRKLLLIISLSGCAITLITEGVCCMIVELLQKDIHYISWLSTASLLIYTIMRPLGIGTLPYVLMGELFATNIRHHAVAFCGTINAVTGFIMLKYFGIVGDVNALYVTFWVFAVICIIGALFVHYTIPETKCKTFAEIQQRLQSVRKPRVGGQPI